ncbi:diguanylate cyclase [Rhodovulum kholense]|uniref:Diguanylate cyclase with GGDEF domain n=1 Tax=Rhodovulum kholense TaxID=453584 RepID=A0A8E2VPL1_9RHOB|nr:diguanylate cyclase [Rhodovulum kholense]PTW52117.1 diguanylate cyclase with GGDEF domain [Rhodovulum kholense]
MPNLAAFPAHALSRQALRLLGLAMLVAALAGALPVSLIPPHREAASLHPAAAAGFALFALSLLGRRPAGRSLTIWTGLGLGAALIGAQGLLEALLPGWPQAISGTSLPGMLATDAGFDLPSAYAVLTLNLGLAVKPFSRGAALALLAAAWTGIWWVAMGTVLAAADGRQPVAAFGLVCMLLGGLALGHVLRADPVLRPLFARGRHGLRARGLLGLALAMPWLAGLAAERLFPEARSARPALELLIGLLGGAQVALVLALAASMDRVVRAEARTERFDPVAGRASRFRPDRDLLDGKGPVGVILCAPAGHGTATGPGDGIMGRALQVATRTLRDEDSVGRWRGRNLLVVAHVPSETELARMAERLARALAPDLPEAAIGLSMAAFDEPSVEAALRRAEGALYIAERRGARHPVRASGLADGTDPSRQRSGGAGDRCGPQRVARDPKTRDGRITGVTVREG